VGTRQKQPVTQAIRALRAAGVSFEGHAYPYVQGGGTGQFARAKGIDEHLVIKTLVMEDEKARPLLVLMHGDREVATGVLARAIGAKRIQPCDAQTAFRHSGYQVGGTSPFGTRRRMPVYCEASIAQLPRIYINGGRRGYIISVDTSEALKLLHATLVNAAR
jgi:Cys-tRNA(Pro) deacylase